MAGNGAAGGADDNFRIIADTLANGAAGGVQIVLRDTGGGDEDAGGIKCIAICKPLADILIHALVKVAAVLLAHLHLAVNDLDAGLELEQIGAQCCDAGAATALVQIFELIDDEAGVDFLDCSLQLIQDFFDSPAFCCQFAGANDEVTVTAGEIARVEDIYIIYFLCSENGVLVGGRKVTADGKVDHCVVFRTQLGECVQILADVAGGGEAQLTGALIILEYIVGLHIDLITQRFAVHIDIKRHDIHTVTLCQLSGEITGTL